MEKIHHHQGRRLRPNKGQAQNMCNQKRKEYAADTTWIKSKTSQETIEIKVNINSQHHYNTFFYNFFFSTMLLALENCLNRCSSNTPQIAQTHQTNPPEKYPQVI